MIRIGGNPTLRSLPLVAGVAAVLGLVLAGPVSLLVAAAGVPEAGSWVLAFVLVWAVLGGLIVGIAGIAYGSVHWDPDARVARLRGRTVPLESITEAWRALSSSSQYGTAYLAYRFVSTEGASVRVLVAGRPMRGLDAEGIAALGRFVAELPLELPKPAAVDAGRNALTERQKAAAVNLTDGGGRSRVARETLLEELGAAQGVTPAPPAAPPVYPDDPDRFITAARADRLAREWGADDALAATLLDGLPRTARRLRRLFFWLQVALFGVAAVVLIAAVVQETIDGPLGSVDNDVVTLFFVGGGLSGLLAHLAWCAAADVDVRARRRAAREWRAARSDDERRRGLPAPFLLAWGESGLRLLAASGFVVATLGLLVALASIFLFTMEDLSAAPGSAVLIVGVLMIAAAVAAFVRVQRQKRRDAEELVVLGGWRLLPPEIRG